MYGDRVPRVSVIVPAYNAEAVIGEAITSVVEGTYEDWELVACDDGSQDATAEVVAAHPDPRVRLIRSGSNGGPAMARNLALERSTGELVAFLDSDDRWLPAFLSAQVALYDESGPGVGIVSCDAWLVDGQGRPVGRHSDVVGGGDGVGLGELLEGNRIYVSTLCPRQVVHEAGGFSAECFGSEDHDLWLRILELGYRVVHNPAPLAVYAAGLDGVSSDRGRMAVTDQATYRRALARGRLAPRQRRIARRRLAIARAAEAREAGRRGAMFRAAASAALVDPAGFAREGAARLRRGRTA